MKSVIQFFSRLLIISGIVFFLVGTLLFIQRFNPERVSFSFAPVLIDEAKADTVPLSKLKIERVKIDLPILEGSIKGDKWDVSKTGVTHLVGSSVPGDIGNSIFYGHNWNYLLGRLVEVYPGDLIQISFVNGVTKQFIVKYTFEVSPNDTSILAQTDKRIITIYTCSGFLDSKRFVVVAEER